MNNLIIIGNGFDLAHGLKTSYNDFLEYIVDSHCQDKNCYSDLFKLPQYITSYKHLKQEISSPGSSFDNYFHNDRDYWAHYDCTDNANYHGLKPEHLTFKNQLMTKLISQISLENWCDIEELYFNLLMNDIEDDFLIYTDYPRLLNKDFELLKRHLQLYLIEQEKEAKEIESYSEFFTSINSPETLLLNFNYTHTIENLYKTETNRSRIIHIHGEIDNPFNPIIFGYAADDKEARDLLSKNDKEYLRYIKKQQYKRTENEHNLSKYLDSHEQIYLTILGHSCGLSDKLILKQILNHPNIQKEDRSIYIFYYKEYESYFETQVNIDRIMNNDERFRKLIVDFSNCDNTPQLDENHKLEKFLRFLKTQKNKIQFRRDIMPRF